MKLLLDTVNLDEIQKGINRYPISGITSNPSIIKKEGKVNFFEHLQKIQEIIGSSRTLHIQVTATSVEGILKDAEALVRQFGKEIYIKIPVSKTGIEAIKILSEKGYNITATAVYTTMQGLLALMAGAKYIAIYYNRMNNLDIDPNRVIKNISLEIDKGNYNCEIIAASFKNVKQVTDAYYYGATSCTISFILAETILEVPSISKAVGDFTEDWNSIYPDCNLSDLE